MSSPPRLFPPDTLDQLAEDLALARAAAIVDAGRVAALIDRWRPLVQPDTREEEPFDLVTPTGEPTGVTAPRWLCHLLGLCHRTVHLALRAPQGLLVLQMRSRDVPNWPRRLDLAVTGHVRAGLSPADALARESGEELGLELDPAAGGVLPPGPQFVQRYCRQETDSVNPPEHICHVTHLYAATLTAAGLSSLHFADGEVDGLYLCSPTEAMRLVAEEPERVAPGLAQSLPRFLAWIAQESQPASLASLP
jgi:isopentenyldiphosphate isomerase